MTQAKRHYLHYRALSKQVTKDNLNGGGKALERWTSQGTKCGVYRVESSGEFQGYFYGLMEKGTSIASTKAYKSLRKAIVAIEDYAFFCRRLSVELRRKGNTHETAWQKIDAIYGERYIQRKFFLIT